MSFATIVVIAIKALRRNAMRTALTALGMIIGVAAVIVMVAIGTGARSSIETQIRSAGSNIVQVNAGSGRFGPVRQGQGAVTTLTDQDATAIAEDVSGIRYVSPTINTRSQIVAETGNWNTQVQGTNADLPAIRSWPVQTGSFFTPQDVTVAAKVVVLGSTVRDQLFGEGVDPVGQTVRINNQPFRVLGVLTTKGQAAFGQDQDDAVFTPYTTVQKKMLGVQHVTGILISAQDNVPLDTVSTQVASLLRDRHRLDPADDDDFMVRTQEEMATVLTSTTTTMTWLLAGIAAVSLLVGGIGIMNIMLVSVTERTREIGLRLSIGARDLDVLTQFLVEAIVLSVAGGVIGILLGIGFALGVSRVAHWATDVTIQSVVLSFAVAAATGIFFGYYPARKAASLDPIDALRYE
ncbi:MAG TPA: ABC transporter permease [Vicinamibacterales bacterium]|jgi:putative ABC transport system permease protein|nr:ABC transporter permease [Vicinamibacterales bacterium]